MVSHKICFSLFVLLIYNNNLNKNKLVPLQSGTNHTDDWRAWQSYFADNYLEIISVYPDSEVWWYTHRRLVFQPEREALKYCIMNSVVAIYSLYKVFPVTALQAVTRMNENMTTTVKVYMLFKSRTLYPPPNNLFFPLIQRELLFVHRQEKITMVHRTIIRYLRVSHLVASIVASHNLSPRCSEELMRVD